MHRLLCLGGPDLWVAQIAPVLLINGQMTICQYHAGRMRWYLKTSATSATPQIVFQASSPITSPHQTYLLPLQVTHNAVGDLYPATIGQTTQPAQRQFDP